LFDEGVRLLRGLRYREAILSLREGIRRHPDGSHVARARKYIEIAERAIRRRQARRLFEQGAALLKKERYKPAIVSLRASIRLHPDGPHAARARQHLETIEHKGADRLSLARELLERKRYLLAREQFEMVAEEFAGLRPAEQARKEADALAGSPAFVRAKREADANALLERARGQDKKQQYYAAWTRYQRLADAYTGTAAGETARKRLAEIEADPKLLERVRQQRVDHRTSGWFAMAENYRQNAERLTGAARKRFVARAREFYNRILSTYPTCPLAAKARIGLASLAELEK